MSAANVTADDKSIGSYKELLVEKRDCVLIITINRPDVRNALNRRAYYEIIRALRTGRITPDISMIVITGMGDFFTAGNDLKQTQGYSDVSSFFRSCNYVLRRLCKEFIYCPKVLVALVNGPCYGIGFTLCALCDVVYCVESAYFKAPFSALGICPEAGATLLFPRLMGRVKAAEALIFGTRITAEEALKSNFVARIYSKSAWNTELWPQIVEYSQLPTESLKVTKRLLRNREREEILQAIERECKELEILRYSETYLKAIEKFVEREKHKNSNNRSKL